MQESIFEILRAAASASKFTPFISGTEVTLLNGKKVRFKIVSSENRYRAEGFRVSKYSILTKVQSNEDNICYTGCGESDVEIIALQKSIAEAIERALFKITKISGDGTPTTNGWAAHVSLGQARQNGLLEMIERDAILVHWFTKTPMMELTQELFPAWLKTWVRNELSLAPRFKSLRVGISQRGYVPTVTTVLLDGLGHGVTSHASGSTLSQAIYKALIETCRIAQGTLASHSFDESLNLVSGNVSDTLIPEHHPLVYAYHLKFPEWFFGEKCARSQASIVWKQRYQQFLKNPPEFKFKTVCASPLVVGYCQSDKVQNLFFGPTNSSIQLLNLKRLNDVSGGVSEINEFPHCVG